MPLLRHHRLAVFAGPIALLALSATALSGCRPAAGSATPAPVTGSSSPGGAAVATSPAPAALPVPPAGSSAGTLTVDGRSRTYRIYRPATLPAGRPVPLVVMLHGGFGSGRQAEQSYGWDAEADRFGFVVLYPDGLNHAWNVGGGCCGVPARTGVDDVAFISRLVADVQAQLPIDTRRTYATGISNGGMLSYRLACDTRLFAAIGPDSATLLGPCPGPAPTSVIHIHGTADTTIRYLGGRGGGVGPHRRAARPRPGRALAGHRLLPRADGDHVRAGHHHQRQLPARPGGRADRRRRSGSPVARVPTPLDAGEAARPRPALAGTQRHRHHLAVLRRPPGSGGGLIGVAGVGGPAAQPITRRVAAARTRPGSPPARAPAIAARAAIAPQAPCTPPPGGAPAPAR